MKRVSKSVPWNRIVRMLLAGLSFLYAGASFGETSAISIAKGALIRNGHVWMPKGVVIAGLVCAARTVVKCGPVYQFARAQWGDKEIAEIRQYGADTVNLKVSQPALDPDSGYHDPGYVTVVTDAVGRLRAAGLNVIVSMMSEGPTGVPGQAVMPTGPDVSPPASSTTRAWRALAPHVGKDPGVMLQVFDEPCARDDSPATWTEWQIGHEQAIRTIREAGAKNILIVEGLHCGKSFAHMPALEDPLNRLVYGVHPYAYKYHAPGASMLSDADFERNFGRWQSAGHVMIATEWNVGMIGSCHDGADGQPDNGQLATTLLTYLHDHGIGVVIWAFDLPSTVWVARTHEKLTSLKTSDCSRWHPYGAGAMVHQYFETGLSDIQ